MSYYLQALVFAVFASVVFQPRVTTRIVPVVVSAIWFVGVTSIYWRYGPIGQWSFYQNDQYFHWRVLDQLFISEFNLTFDRLNFLRAPYTAPAYALSRIGLDPTLSLKFVSLCCAVGNLGLIDRFLARRNYKFSLARFWMVAGPISVFFSLLALRETMMILCVTQLFIGISQGGKAVSLITLLILRPHLAAAIVFGQLWGWLFSRIHRRWYLLSVLATAVVPIYIGTIGFSLGNYIIYRLPLRLYQDLFLKDQVIQIFSAFAGLQFFTVAYQTVEFTTRSLLLIRIVFPEIVLVPLLFTAGCFFFTPKTTRLKLSVLASFVFFMAVSSGTEYLSVRQSLPMMSIMGIAAILTFFQPSTDQETLKKVEQLTGV